MGAYFLADYIGAIAMVSLGITAAIVILFGWIMPRKTKKGVLVKEHILGLKEFLTVVEKEKFKFHYAPEKNPKLFEKLLPYAMALQVENQWAKKFEGIYTDKPGWYQDSQGGAFSPIIFAGSMSSFTTKFNNAMTAASKGSGVGGGGFSGGGFGGGGGGSW